MGKHVLLVDDDALMRRSLSYNLSQQGYRVSTASNGRDAHALAQQDTPDVILLDIGLPEMDGLDTLRLIRQSVQAPIIFVTARRQEIDQVVGLELGADDYVCKPFDLNVLLARIRAVLRRNTPVVVPAPSSPIVLDDLTIDPSAHSVRLDGHLVDLAPREFTLLYTLALEPGRVFPVDELLTRVWGSQYEGEPQVVYVHIRWLREKIEKDPKHPQRIISVRGVGYKLNY